MLKDQIVTKKFYEDHTHKNLFLKGLECDILLVLKNKSFPLHKFIIEESQYLTNKSSETQRVFIIQQNLDIESMEIVLASLYGYTLQHSRNSSILKIMEVVEFLGLKRLRKYFYEDFNVNFHKYGIYLLHKISKQYSINWLFQKCQLNIKNESNYATNLDKQNYASIQCETLQKLQGMYKMKNKRVIVRKRQLNQKIKTNLQKAMSLSPSTKVDPSQSCLSLRVEQCYLKSNKCNQVDITYKKQEIRRRNTTQDLNIKKQLSYDDSNQNWSQINIRRKASNANICNQVDLKYEATKYEIEKITKINMAIQMELVSMSSQIKQLHFQIKNNLQFSQLTMEQKFQKTELQMGQIQREFIKLDSKVMQLFKGIQQYANMSYKSKQPI